MNAMPVFALFVDVLLNDGSDIEIGTMGLSLVKRRGNRRKGEKEEGDEQRREER